MTTEPDDRPNEAPPVTVENSDGTLTHKGRRYVPAPVWRSLKDDPPPPAQWVLAGWAGTEMTTPYFTGKGEAWRCGNATHWCEIVPPAFPKEDTA